MPHQVQTDGVVRVDIGIFAHNEEKVIARLITDLSRQSVLTGGLADLHIWIMVNGSRDGTAAAAEAARRALDPALGDRFTVVDLAQGGKSRTVHRFIHHQSRADASVLGFMDADIQLPETDTLERMLHALATRPELQAFTSRPVKDVHHFKLDVGPVAKVIAAGGDGLTNFRKSICGQLYMLRADMARRIALPDGLPVEDGFVRAMVVTDLFSMPEDLTRIDGDPAVYHVYESIRGLGELLHHQTRLVVGSAINAALYARFRRAGLSGDALRAVLMESAQDAGWLPRVLAEELPKRPFGFVPFKFAINRISAYRKFGARSLRSLVILGIGVTMDMLVYLRASLRMWRGQGAGFW